jgi:hypothetical protein
MPNTIFIDSNQLPRTQGPQGEFTEILNNTLAGAKNVLAVLRWLESGEKFDADEGDRHQLIYLMEGNGIISLQNKEHEVSQGMGVYLGPSESATIQAAPGASLKMFHLVVPQIPR